MSFFAQWFTRDEVNFLDNHSDISKMIKCAYKLPYRNFFVSVYKIISE